jgi:CheY-like chemotaxis protein
VGNHQIVRATINEQLTTWGMVPEEVATPDKTLGKLVQATEEQRPYALLILGNDVGEALIRQVRETPAIKETAIIVTLPLTAEANQEFFAKYAVGCLRKPIFVSALFDAIMDQLFRDYAAGSAVQTPLPSNVGSHRKLTESIRILVAEDNRVNQIVIQNVLTRAGLECEVANNGREALHATITQQFDVILMDCQMPDIDGYETTMLIRTWEQEQNRPRIPIIALTANAVMGDEQKCLDVGMDAYCHKPIDPDFVIETIERWYSLSKAKNDKNSI